ncbi:MAG: hypothetical protein K0R38_920 [Polyangiaceae bacterium]|jgi:hypothetical protein|nr:hypothetical protein [Polyangiaceae bacterium]
MNIYRNIPTFLSLLVLGACSPEKGSEEARGGVQVAISGEDIATEGISFPTGSEVTFVDGWAIELSHVLVTVGNVTLSETPDLVPSDQSRTGAVVASAAGPWAVDLHVAGTIDAAGGEGLATPLTLIENQNQRGGKAFAPEDRYAFGYEVVPASAEAQVVNFEGDEVAEAAYAEMIEAGATVLYIGTATFRGEDCKVADESYDFDKLPREVPFRLAFRTPTSFLNCQNQDVEGNALDDEEYPRGVAIPSNRNALAQITLHLEHAWFSSTVHDPALRFDPLAARLVGKPAGTVVTLEDIAGVDPSAFTDSEGTPLPARSCDGSALPSGQQLRFDSGSVPLDPSAKPSEALRDYRDFAGYVQSTQGHLNGGEGLCFPERHYPSPP